AWWPLWNAASTLPRPISNVCVFPLIFCKRSLRRTLVCRRTLAVMHDCWMIFSIHPFRVKPRNCLLPDDRRRQGPGSWSLDAYLTRMRLIRPCSPCVCGSSPVAIWRCFGWQTAVMNASSLFQRQTSRLVREKPSFGNCIRYSSDKELERRDCATGLANPVLPRCPTPSLCCRRPEKQWLSVSG